MEWVVLRRKMRDGLKLQSKINLHKLLNATRYSPKSSFYFIVTFHDRKPFTETIEKNLPKSKMGLYNVLLKRFNTD